MAEYLIQSGTLDDIADAINAKTGGSSAMTPAQMVTAIGSISGGGSGLQFAAGTVTLAAAGTITVPHNLNSTNVVCLICPTGTIQSTVRYQHMALVAANFTEEFATDLANVEYDFTSYNSENYPEIVARTGPYPIGVAFKSPFTSHPYATWNSASSWCIDAAFSGSQGDAQVSFLQNSVTLNNCAQGTYKWVVIKL